MRQTCSDNSLARDTGRVVRLPNRTSPVRRCESAKSREPAFGYIASTEAIGHEPTFDDRNVRHHAASSSSRASACFKSNVSKPSVNQL